MRLRAFVRAAVCTTTTALLLVLPSLAALAQEETPETGGPPWTYYMAYATMGIAGLALLATLAGYLVQSKGWKQAKAEAKSGQQQTAGTPK